MRHLTFDHAGNLGYLISRHLIEVNSDALHYSQLVEEIRYDFAHLDGPCHPVPSQRVEGKDDHHAYRSGPVEGIDHTHSVGNIDLHSCTVSETRAVADNQGLPAFGSIPLIHLIRNGNGIDVSGARFSFRRGVESLMVLMEISSGDEGGQLSEFSKFEVISKELKDVGGLAAARVSNHEQDVFVLNQSPCIIGLVDQSLQFQDINRKDLGLKGAQRLIGLLRISCLLEECINLRWQRDTFLHVFGLDCLDITLELGCGKTSLNNTPSTLIFVHMGKDDFSL